jgi:predicted SAM-dependent methyltransferase
MVIDHTERKHDLEVREIIKSICIGKGLDIGCANRPINETCDTVDIEPKYNTTYCCNAEYLHLIDDETYDWVTACHILEHLDNTIGALYEWQRVLKTGGKLGIIVPHGEGVDSKDLGDSSMTHRTLFTKKTLQLFLEHVGFKILEIKEVPRPLAYKENPAIIAICQK